MSKDYPILKMYKLRETETRPNASAYATQLSNNPGQSGVERHDNGLERQEKIYDPETVGRLDSAWLLVQSLHLSI